MLTVVNKKTFKRPTGNNIVIPIHRPHPLGNPFVLHDVNDDMERDSVIDKYEQWLYKQVTEGNTNVLDELNRILIARDQYDDVFLQCFCAPKKCHGDVIVYYLFSKEVLNALG